MNPITRGEILTTAEVHAVFRDLRRKQTAAIGTRQNLVLFELAVCYGLRATEIVLLRLRDIAISNKRAELDTVTLKQRRRHPGRQPGRPAAGNLPRRQIPLEIAPEALKDLRDWKAIRKRMQAGPGDPLLCTLSRAPANAQRLAITGPRHQFTNPDAPDAVRSLSGCQRGPGRSLTRGELWRRFKVACKVLGPDRVGRLKLHHARHTFASHALSRAIPPQVVCAWLGHKSLAVTTIYAHVLDELDGSPPRTVYELPA